MQNENFNENWKYGSADAHKCMHVLILVLSFDERRMSYDRTNQIDLIGGYSFVHSELAMANLDLSIAHYSDAGSIQPSFSLLSALASFAISFYLLWFSSTHQWPRVGLPRQLHSTNAKLYLLFVLPQPTSPRLATQPVIYGKRLLFSCPVSLSSICLQCLGWDLLPFMIKGQTITEMAAFFTKCRIQLHLSFAMELEAVEKATLLLCLLTFTLLAAAILNPGVKTQAFHFHTGSSVCKEVGLFPHKPITPNVFIMRILLYFESEH